LTPLETQLGEALEILDSWGYVKQLCPCPNCVVPSKALADYRDAKAIPPSPLDASVKRLAQDIEDLYMFHGNETPIEEVEKLIAVRDEEIIAMSKKP
jgi:hypothetical protein